MAGYTGDGWNNQSSSYNFPVSDDQFGGELNFQTFDQNQGNVPPAPYGVSSQATYNPGTFMDSTHGPYGGEIYTPQNSMPQSSFNPEVSNEFEDEPPLLEELGIFPQQILQKTLSVLNPMRTTDSSILQDTDLAGPLVFCLALGAFLLLRGKVSFSYIYGIGVMGCLAFYGLLSLMATQATVHFGAVVSVLGYCLLPMVALSGLTVIISLQGIFGTILSGVSILWCAISASKLFVTAYSMDHQQILIAYPCALLYGVFGLLVVF